MHCYSRMGERTASQLQFRNIYLQYRAGHARIFNWSAKREIFRLSLQSSKAQNCRRAKAPISGAEKDLDRK